MKYAQTTSHLAETGVSAGDEAAGFYPDGLTESAIDALIASVDQELASTDETAAVRVSHTFADARTANRARRRAGRSVLRSVPVRLDTSAVSSFDGEAA
ncbi:hypothetical protein [Amycolatopsis sp. CA-230715]|uniref:hypothetical protein n=1 Tax=Amycolatopsis sp. CA-230715 TaxID=2745196 RepID=UPI001C03228E|nr:hypothetical protein [Amycolatopsis sp. CA-230715]QWF80447.1 hypothetical protein HUW46_03869 [Amycolatopsis sp. CA-230715]